MKTSLFLRKELLLSLILGFVGVFGLRQHTAFAATSPSLGVAAPYSVLAGSNVTNTGATTISGNVGISPGFGAAPHYTGFGTVTLGGIIDDANASSLAAQGAKDTAFGDLASQGCDTTYAGTKELAGVTLIPGVYCADSFHLSSGTLTLSGTSSDVWIFKSSSDLIITGSSALVTFSGGGLPCNVWWRVVSTATFAAGSTFVGNVLASTSITFAAGASLNGRALASTAEVTFDSAAISGPTCTSPTSSSVFSTNDRTITVIKQVINDNGGTSVIGDFPLFINANPITSGQTSSYTPGLYVITENSLPTYTATFSGDCDATGHLNHNHNDLPARDDVCIITNDDIGAPVVVPPVPPIISVVKVPSPLALPDGPGPVTYTYTLHNIGTVPVTDITMIDDSCTVMAFVSGDLNADTKLDFDETWLYRCTVTLSATHTNIVVATGWANGLSTSDAASATVVVGIPVVPPLIHVTKVPNPLALIAGGGNVTYTEIVTNPGTVPLSHVTLTDDKCSPVTRISGDVNNDDLLDVSESWTYTCTTALTKNTTNTAVATGQANGFTATDFAIATVIVAVAPLLPNTGAASAGMNAMIPLVIMSVLAASLFFIMRKNTSPLSIPR